MKLRAIAVDDEQHCINTLKYELERHCPTVDLVATYSAADEAYDALLNADIEILFLDIHLKSTSGIELLRRLSPVDYQVVFVTAYDEYAIQAFDLAATHYLLKPISGFKLKDAIGRITDQLSSSNKQGLEELLEHFKHSIDSVRRVALPVQEGIEFVDPATVLYVGGDNNYSRVRFTNGKELVVSKTLRLIEDMFPKSDFVRVHKSYLVNTEFITRYVRSDGGYIVMSNGEKLPVSRQRKSDIGQLFQ